MTFAGAQIRIKGNEERMGAIGELLRRIDLMESSDIVKYLIRVQDFQPELNSLRMKARTELRNLEAENLKLNSAELK